jgi:coenzyme F420 biosynthesis associated uncharacterized protein
MSDIDPSDLANSLSNIPLFREIQRVLMAQTGPVNWEIARQIASAVSEAGGAGPAHDEKDVEQLTEAARIAELHLTRVTRLESPAALERIEVVDRRGWADRNLDGMKPLIERFAGRFEGSGAMPGVLGAVGPFLIGVQVGFLVGYLSRRVLGQYDLCLPRPGDETLYFVFPNIVQVERELEFDPQQFRMWLALHEVTHHLEFQGPRWTRPHFIGLIESFVDASEVDPQQLVEKLQGFGDPERWNYIASHPEELLPLMMTDAQRKVAEEIQSFMSVLEGFAEWAMDAAGKDLLPEFEKMREGINRRRVERSSIEKMLEGLLGIDLKMQQYRAGEKFVSAVARADKLDLLWVGAENLPSSAEIENPASWLSRVAFS